MANKTHDGDVAFIKALAELLEANDLTEVEVMREYGDNDSLNVRVSRQPAVAPAPAPVYHAPAVPVAAPAAAPAAARRPDLTHGRHRLYGPGTRSPKFRVGGR